MKKAMDALKELIEMTIVIDQREKKYRDELIQIIADAIIEEAKK